MAAALAALGVGTALSQAGRRGGPPSPLPAADNPGPHGLQAARELLEALGSPVAVRRPGDAPPPGARVVIVAAPQLGAGEGAAAAAELLAAAEEGATVVLALGRSPPPDLLAGLGLDFTQGDEPRTAHGRAPHRLVGDLDLPARGAALRALRPEALAVSGGDGWASAVSVPAGHGRGEVLVLAGPEPLENAHLLEGDAVSLVTRLGALGPVTFDERYLAPAPVAAGPAERALGLLALQLLLGGLAVVAARGRRLGAVRPAPPPASGRTARAYLASLAALYQRSGAEPELAAATWGALRRRLERRHAIPASLSDAEAARRAARLSSAAALALARGGAALAGGGAGVLLAVTQAAADAEAALERR